ADRFTSLLDPDSVGNPGLSTIHVDFHRTAPPPGDRTSECCIPITPPRPGEMVVRADFSALRGAPDIGCYQHHFSASVHYAEATAAMDDGCPNRPACWRRTRLRLYLA